MKISDVVEAMIRYEDGNIHNVNHAMKVYAYAQTIGEAQGLPANEQETLEIAAVLHDIGIKKSVLKYGSSAGNYQELEGPPIARAILQLLGADNEIIERVCWLIAHHHTYHTIDGLDHQILIEADFLVNMDEGRMQSEEIAKVRERIFRTKTGKNLLDQMFPNRGKKLSETERRLLIKEALSAREKAYTPYSHFAVGAALLTNTGRIFRGCNIESASYSPTNCAERTAFFKAVSEGEREFRAIAIAGGPAGKPVEQLCPPCGVCRQVMREFCAPDFLVYFAASAEQWQCFTLEKLLPHSFSLREEP